MTHDELLAKIDNNYFPGFTHMEQVEEMVKQDTQIKAALRAVVELHKPEGVCSDPDCKPQHDWCSCGMDAYPCPTIQAIEEELK